jgi:hypothetical protein
MQQGRLAKRQRIAGVGDNLSADCDTMRDGFASIEMGWSGPGSVAGEVGCKSLRRRLCRHLGSLEWIFAVPVTLQRALPHTRNIAAPSAALNLVWKASHKGNV